MSNYLYCASFGFAAVRIAKIGTTANPRSRISTFVQVSPFPLARLALKLFPSRGEADAWERYLIGAATRYRDGSEWVVDDEALTTLWDGISGGEDATLDLTYAGRVIPNKTPDQNRAAAFAERLRSRVGPAVAVSVGYKGDPEQFERAIIKARLLQGYGVEDIAVLDGLDAGVIRDEIHRLRVLGQLAAIYRQQRGAA